MLDDVEEEEDTEDGDPLVPSNKIATQNPHFSRSKYFWGMSNKSVCVLLAFPQWPMYIPIYRVTKVIGIASKLKKYQSIEYYKLFIVINCVYILVSIFSSDI